MAITLEDLFGKNIKTPTEKVDTFPTYEEFSSRNSSTQVAQNTVQDNKYDYFAPRQYVQPMSVDEVREHNASRSYIRPQNNEFNEQYMNNYAQVQEVLPPADVSLDNEFSPRLGNEEYKPLSLFDFTVHDHDRLSNGELDSKLSYSASKQMYIAFNGEIASKPAVQVTQKVKKEKKNLFKSHIAHREKEGKKKRLSLKGKIIIGAYIALIVTVVVLIGVNAKKINNGLSLAPTGNTQIEQTIEG